MAKWMQKVREGMERKGTKGALHKMMGVPQGETIPFHRLVAAARAKGKLGKRARCALNMRRAGK